MESLISKSSPASGVNRAERNVEVNCTIEQIQVCRAELAEVWQRNRRQTSQVRTCQSAPSTTILTPAGKSCFLVIVDTNVFLDDQSFLRSMISRKHDAADVVILAIPWVVIQELDYIKDNRQRKYVAQLTGKAKTAVSMINKWLADRNPRVVGQTPAEFKEGLQDFPTVSNDDAILQCCLQFKQKYVPRYVALLSMDRNLQNKAMIAGIQCYSYEGLMTALSNKTTVTVTSGCLRSSGSPPHTIASVRACGDVANLPATVSNPSVSSLNSSMPSCRKLPNTLRYKISSKSLIADRINRSFAVTEESSVTPRPIVSGVKRPMDNVGYATGPKFSPPLSKSCVPMQNGAQFERSPLNRSESGAQIYCQKNDSGQMKSESLKSCNKAAVSQNYGDKKVWEETDQHKRKSIKRKGEPVSDDCTGQQTINISSPPSQQWNPCQSKSINNGNYGSSTNSINTQLVSNSIVSEPHNLRGLNGSGKIVTNSRVESRGPLNFGVSRYAGRASFPQKETFRHVPNVAAVKETDSQADACWKLFENFCLTLSCELSRFIKAELFNVYGGTWRTRVVCEPPWTVIQALECLRRNHPVLFRPYWTVERAEILLYNLVTLINLISDSRICSANEIRNLLQTSMKFCQLFEPKNKFLSVKYDLRRRLACMINAEVLRKNRPVQASAVSSTCDPLSGQSDGIRNSGGNQTVVRKATAANIQPVKSVAPRTLSVTSTCSPSVTSSPANTVMTSSTAARPSATSVSSAVGSVKASAVVSRIATSSVGTLPFTSSASTTLAVTLSLTGSSSVTSSGSHTVMKSLSPAVDVSSNDVEMTTLNVTEAVDRVLPCCGGDARKHDANLRVTLSVFNDIWCAISTNRVAAESQLSAGVDSERRVDIFNIFLNFCVRVWSLYRAYCNTLSRLNTTDIGLSEFVDLTYEIHCFEATVFPEKNFNILPHTLYCLLLDPGSRSLLETGREQLKQEMLSICQLGSLLSCAEREQIELHCQQCLSQ